MKKIDGNSSAYPQARFEYDKNAQSFSGGITIRAQMAAMICGAIAKSDLTVDMDEGEVARAAILQADALIAELNKTEGTTK
jgi:hypothetical protein